MQKYYKENMSQHMRFWYLLRRESVMAKMSLHICSLCRAFLVSQTEHLKVDQASNQNLDLRNGGLNFGLRLVCRYSLRPKFRSSVPLASCTCWSKNDLCRTDKYHYLLGSKCYSTYENILQQNSNQEIFLFWINFFF